MDAALRMSGKRARANSEERLIVDTLLYNGAVTEKEMEPRAFLFFCPALFRRETLRHVCMLIGITLLEDTVVIAFLKFSFVCFHFFNEIASKLSTGVNIEKERGQKCTNRSSKRVGK